MLYTEESVRDCIRNRDGKRVFYLGTGDTLTPGARDWLSRERIVILPSEQARPERFRLLGGGYLEEKPEHMTHLNGEVLVSKLHPRIGFRGAVDTLESEILLAQTQLPDELSADLQEILDLARLTIRCDVLEEPLNRDTLCGLTESQQRQHSHWPQEFYGQPHFMPSKADGAQIAWLNRVRCSARAAELKAVAAFTDENGSPTRPDILRAMNRLSSMVYILMIRMKAGRK